MTLGQELQNARKAAGLSQETVAFDAEIDRSYLSDIERDQHSPTVERLLRICKAIGVKPSEVFQGFEEG